MEVRRKSALRLIFGWDIDKNLTSVPRQCFNDRCHDQSGSDCNMIYGLYINWEGFGASCIEPIANSRSKIHRMGWKSLVRNAICIFGSFLGNLSRKVFLISPTDQRLERKYFKYNANCHKKELLKMKQHTESQGCRSRQVSLVRHPSVNQNTSATFSPAISPFRPSQSSVSSISSQKWSNQIHNSIARNVLFGKTWVVSPHTNLFQNALSNHH